VEKTLAITLLVSLLTQTPATAVEPSRGPLKDYLAQPDSSYRWVVKREGMLLKSTAYAELILTSQTWRDIPWKHQLFLIKPSSTQSENEHALVYIGGGSWNDRLEEASATENLNDEVRVLGVMAERFKTPVIVLRQVPHQPIFDGKYEDAIIAYTFEQYLRTGDAQWPLLLPMVKSVVRAMDTAQEFAAKQWSLNLKTFTVTGASKRGWTTWLTSAVDPRVTALAPMVIDILNMLPQLNHQEAVWGEPSHKIHDYTDRGLHRVLRTEKGMALQQIVDPYQYRHQLTQPKLIMLGTNDDYWPLDALNLYWSDLAGEKYILYVPNNGHGLSDLTRVFGGLNALNQQAANGYRLPKLKWQFEENGDRLRLEVRSEPKAQKIVAWVATATTRDFRKAQWHSFPMEGNGEQAKYNLPVPEDGFAAMFGEAEYVLDDAPYYFSTNVKVLPPKESAE